MLNKIRTFVENLSLNQRFMLTGLVILLAGMLGIGAWVQNQIELGVIHRTGATTALYVDSFVAPILQDLGWAEELTADQAAQLRDLLDSTAMRQQIVAMKVWDTRGKLLFTTDSSQVGISYPMHEGMLQARTGLVNSELSELEHVENAALKTQHDQLLEIYSPVWLSGTDQVIAVAEFYQLTDDLNAETTLLKRQSWLVVGAVILLMYLLLSGLVRTASRTITRQKGELAGKVQQLTALLDENRRLSGKVRRAAASVALLNEGYLHRVGAELHDGPAQDLSLSILKLDALAGQVETKPGPDEARHVIEQVTEVSTSIQSALKEMRTIAAGLSLPQLNELSLPETVLRAVRAHQRSTGTSVVLEGSGIPDPVSLPLRITVYRLIQEALNNAFKHAGGAGQKVCVYEQDDGLKVEISDEGPGFSPEKAEGRDGHLGLSGMRERVESLGGTFSIRSEQGRGTVVSASLPILREEEGRDG